MLSQSPTLTPAAATTPSRTRNPLVRRRTRPVAAGVKSSWHSLLRLFWACFAALIAWVACRAPSHSSECVIGAFLIILAGMLPSYLWIRGKVRGLPLFPACALTYIWSFALPLVSDQRLITLFPGWNQLMASLSVTGFLLIGTLAWYYVGRRPSRVPQICWMLDEGKSAPWLLIALAICVVWLVASAAGWIKLTGGVLSVIRGILLPIEALASFVLSYRLGRGKLTGPTKAIFFVLMLVALIATLPALLLFYSMSISALAMIAYMAGSKRLPWRVGLVALIVFGFLHIGKAVMRERYWHEGEQESVSPLHYPAFIAEWSAASWDILQHGEDDDSRGDSLLERASLMHWLLYFEASSPNTIPFLDGASYAIIPRLLVPRVLDPDKPLSTEGITIVGVHYGIITREDADVVTIGFGLLNEAFANFGYRGIGGLAIVLGAFYGQVSRWSRGVPVLSLRGLFAISIANYAIQTEYSASFYATSFLQSTGVLLIVAILFMRAQRFSSANTSLLD